MSYILDALKRADAERQRGHVPGLHTRSTPELDAAPRQTARIAARLRLMLLLLAVLLVLGALWWWLGAAPAEPAPTAQVAVPAPATPLEAPSSAPAPAPAPAPVPVPAPEPAKSAQASEPAPPPLPILAPAPPRAAATKPAPEAAPATTKSPASEPAAMPSAPGNAGDAAAPIRSFAELTPEARARLPAVNVSGSTYSKNPTLRMLIINGKVMQEGDEIQPGLTLQTIEPRSAVLNHQGMRYRIGY